MNRRTIETIVVIALMLSMTAASAVVASPATGGKGAVAGPAVPPTEPGTSPGFFENLGQFPDGDVMFYRRVSDVGIAFTGEGVHMTLMEPVDTSALRALSGDPRDHREARDELASLLAEGVAGHGVRLTFEGAAAVTPLGRHVLGGQHNFLIGDDPGAWRTGVLAYSQVVYEDLWEGIDLVYMLSEEGLKYEFHVAPGADVASIRVKVTGAEGLSVEDGGLVISTSVGPLVDSGLVSFHEGAHHRPLPSSFRLLGGDTYGFLVAGRDPGRPLVIDPWVFATYLGGTVDEYVADMDVDADGEIYLVGTTDSDDFPTTAGAFERNLPGWDNGFVTKMKSDGSDLVFSTYIGGSIMESITSVEVDGSEDIHICGYTLSDDFPTTAGVYQTEFIGDWMNFTMMGFVTKLDAGGARLDHSTYLGTDGEDLLYDMTLDGNGRYYVTGFTSSFNMTTTSGAYQTTKQDNDTWYYEGMVNVLDSSAARLLYSTYLGSEDDDIGTSVAVDATGNVYVAGGTYSKGFPNTTGAYQRQNLGFWTSSVFVTKLKPDLTDLVYSTFIGGSEEDAALAMVLHTNGSVTVAGFTESTDYPVSGDAYSTRLNGIGDFFVSSLSADGSQLLRSTFVGGSDDEFLSDMRVDTEGKFHVGGYTYSADFPTTTGAVDDRLDGDMDGYYAIVAGNLSALDYGTYVGGSNDDNVFAVVPAGMFGLVAGETYSNDLKTTTGAYQTRFPGGDWCGFLGKISLDSVAPLAEAGPDVTIDQHETVDFDGSGSSDNVGVVNWTWTFYYDGDDVTLYGVEASFTFHEAGEVGVTLKAMDLGGLVGSDTMTVRVLDITPPVADAGTTRNIDQHETVTFRGTGSTDNVGVVNWTWTLTYGGQGVTLYGPDPQFTFDEAGEYNVSLTIADAVGLTAKDWVMVYVKDITNPAADAGSDLEVDQHDTVTLDATASSDNVDIVNWTWSFVYRGSPMKLYGEVVEFVFDDAGTYEFSLAVTDGTGNMGMDSVTVRVLDITPPIPDAGENMEVVQGTNVDLDGTGSTDNQRIASYTWTFDYQGVPIELIGSTPSYYFDAAGEYVVTLTVADLEGNEATDTVLVVVLDTEAPVADAGEDIFVDQGDTVDLIGTDSTDNVGVTSWVWTFTYEGEAEELTGSTPSFVFDEAGVYTIDLVVQDARGNSHDDQVRVTVRDVTPPVAIAGDDRQSDQGTAVTLDGSGSTDNLGVETYTWTFEYGGSVETLTGRTVQFPFDVPGDYTVTLTVADAAGNEATDDFDLHVRDTLLPVPPTMSSIETGSGKEVTLDGSAATDNVGVVKWTWTFKEGGKTRTLEGQKVKHTFDEAGDYEVTLTVEDAEGNTASTTFDVTVTGSSWLWIVIVVVLVVLVAAAFLMMRRRGGGEEEEAAAPEDAEGKPEIIIEERFAE